MKLFHSQLVKIVILIGMAVKSMKKFLLTIILLVLSLSIGTIAEAKSYSVEKLHIKSWIQPNGDLLVNEVFA